MYLSKNQTSGANPSLKCAVERKWNLDSFASLSRSLKAISRRNRPSRLFLRRRFLTPVFVHISCVSNALACQYKRNTPVYLRGHRRMYLNKTGFRDEPVR